MTQALHLHDVTKLYSNGKGIAGVSFDVQPGEVFGFLGPNGAGKTTTIRCLMDFIRPSSGTVKIFGVSVRDDPIKARGYIGYLPADLQLYPKWSGAQHIALYESYRSTESASKLAKTLNLDLSVSVQHLSSGNKQKLAVVLALCTNPKLLIMDEPTKALDPLLQQQFYQLIADYKKAGGTVFLSSHNLGEVQKICDRVGIIKEGKITAVQTFAALRDLSVRLVTLSATTTLKPDQFKSETVEVLHHSGKHLLLKIHGDINPVLKTAALYDIKDIEIVHASLEDTFLEYYK